MVDEYTLHFFISFIAHISADITKEAATAIFKRIQAVRPDLLETLAKPTPPTDILAALGELAGVLEVFARNGEISIDGALITALRAAHFDHQNGQIRVGNTTVSAPVVQTGGSGSGLTILGSNTELHSKGTTIKIGQGASIIVAGNASIKQT